MVKVTVRYSKLSERSGEIDTFKDVVSAHIHEGLVLLWRRGCQTSICLDRICELTIDAAK